METVSLTGKELAAAINADTKQRAAALADSGAAAKLALIVANADPASAWYVNSLRKAAERLGIACDTVDLGAEATADEIRAELSNRSADAATDAIMLQTPLPSGVTLDDVSSAIAATKDVDGVSPLSLGLLATGLEGFVPATSEAVVELLKHHQIPLSGRHVAVVGRSNVVGKPLAQLLLAENATVTVCHSRTTDLPAVTSAADIVVAAAGRIGLVTGEHAREGAVVIDVGTNEAADGSIVGDVDADSVRGKAAALSPVPGGVGPVTTALLMRHVVVAAEKARTA
ncbi:bifunctional 5,10-methylenetetrahydrofolate dehydrogenase/5,10-methenyltetrahydrofolate cyclohydrolase [Nocardia cyriacigeorgica]|uniref:bifunctional 5,10-methylenetetrahydrofolate dehydrogenase/5,10-methenyltetrahydrofolate cyclohydrolase n=1 Tax=Nocardia cyriacigeorgica TaxID=135487 RepID=UPI001895C03C|nr:bifunctional 5,10-methylenetetrahydrofolate dehydrogenase/5,10-methenyltetrahydrofolate cyclohydrolase [Nocardia cyriacigeorgica]MBF6457143.1 bifunctional 5,10-methylenetetrahydrofolate dehydrogenase/5,10-methenyltetrahydrofolate cyclohydrolase [Nocardia cyriacigeorgica]MBF6479075.1 bifunctional 5,10-methylenetetrahydrofolate dehydrogenase/5,10-methenyltetrahydrofolate cyclohydrolase [Nocardia cyriacigeorgica]MBF6554196.1 bifunctional 5,10-methylenetetrahydrofolate dehydrogenase/5,10-methenyl